MLYFYIFHTKLLFQNNLIKEKTFYQLCVVVMSNSDENKVNNTVKLFIIDDDLTTRILIREMLDDTYISIIESDCGTEAFEIFKERRHEIGLILLDIYLPGCDGWKLIGLIRQVDQQIPVIAMSAMLPSELAAKYRTAGFTGYISKPFDMIRLREIILSYLKPLHNQ